MALKREPVCGDGLRYVFDKHQTRSDGFVRRFPGDRAVISFDRRRSSCMGYNETVANLALRHFAESEISTDSQLDHLRSAVHEAVGF